MNEEGDPVLVKVDDALYLVGRNHMFDKSNPSLDKMYLQPITIVDLDKNGEDEEMKEEVDEEIQDTVAVEE